MGTDKFPNGHNSSGSVVPARNPVGIGRFHDGHNYRKIAGGRTSPVGTGKFPDGHNFSGGKDSTAILWVPVNSPMDTTGYTCTSQLVPLWVLVNSPTDTTLLSVALLFVCIHSVS